MILLRALALPPAASGHAGEAEAERQAVRAAIAQRDVARLECESCRVQLVIGIREPSQSTGSGPTDHPISDVLEPPQSVQVRYLRDP